MGLCHSRKSRSRKDPPNSASLSHNCEHTQWGNSSWVSIHTMLAHLPDDMSDRHRDAVWAQIKGHGHTGPCKYCRRNWRTIIEKLENHKAIIMQSAQSASCMFFEMHNIFNSQLNRAAMDFSHFQQLYGVDFIRLRLCDTIMSDKFNLDDLIMNGNAPPGASIASSDGSTHEEEMHIDLAPESKWDV